MTKPAIRPIVNHAQWRSARSELLAKEKQLTAAREALAQARRALPWVRVEKDYRFATSAGEASLRELFAGRGQLIVYHFMYPADWSAGCKSCSFWADGYNGIVPHLAARDTSLVAVSIAPLAKLLAFRARMGWSFEWVSSAQSDFNRDFGVSFTDEEIASRALLYNFGTQPFGVTEAPGISVFAHADGEIYHTYSGYSRGLDWLNPAYQLLDLVPNGRAEADLPYSMAWVKLHDEY